MKTRKQYRWGATDYLRSFDIGEVKEFTENYDWRGLQAIACRLRAVWGCQFQFDTLPYTKKRMIKRLR